jgi:midasin
LKRGDWVILDELNLAPSEVLEALNRLLDDNRELYLAEVNQVVKPHPNFRLFATQNPCGAYGGRKPLSRAFRNRFVELHIADIPSSEMTTILELRCSCPPSHAKALVAIMDSLRQRRSKSGVFLGKDGLITPRDLLRWAERRAPSKLDLAQDGYMLLAERLRTAEERAIVKEEIEKQFKLKIDMDEVYFGPESAARKMLGNESQEHSGSLLISSIAPTKSILRLLSLVLRCIKQKEPVLLVGGKYSKLVHTIAACVPFATHDDCFCLSTVDTGCGKTTVVELLSVLQHSRLKIINCHATTETSDLIGGLRPVRGRNVIAEKMYHKLRELLFLWPDKDLLKTLDLPTFLDFDPFNDPPCLRPDPVGERASCPLPEGAVLEMITLARTLRKSDVPDQIDTTEESPRKKQKIHAGDSGAYAMSLKLSPLSPVLEEIEDLFRRHSSLFEWVDGAVADTMKSGDMLLLDELSLAEDAVLERINSVLEPSRTLVLAEKGEDVVGSSELDSRVILAHDDFRIFATMNPGGDFGKRELSPALRSRFTEIWVPPVNDRSDIEMVLRRSLAVSGVTVYLTKVLQKMLEYVEWFNKTVCNDTNSPYSGLALSLRDVLAWAHFIVKAREANKSLDLWNAYSHGAALMHLDGLGLGTGLAFDEAMTLKARAQTFLLGQVSDPEKVEAFSNSSSIRYAVRNGSFGVHPFWVPIGQQTIWESSFNFEAPKTAENIYRVLRAMQLSKPILLEGTFWLLSEPIPLHFSSLTYLMPHPFSMNRLSRCWQDKVSFS